MIIKFLSKNPQIGEKNLRMFEAVWYMCLKTENYYLKIFVEICVRKKVR